MERHIFVHMYFVALCALFLYKEDYHNFTSFFICAGSATIIAVLFNFIKERKEKMQSVVNDIFYSIYQYLGFGLVFAVVCVFALPEIKRLGIKPSMRYMWSCLKSNAEYRYKFLFFLYLFMVLSRTLICRNIWQCPWENIIGEWGAFTSEGTFNTEGMLNVLLFFPLVYFGLQGFNQQNKSNKEIAVNIVKISFEFSCAIEMCQLFLRLGTFQLSDIFQNTLGGFIGAAVYIAQRKIKKRGNKKYEHNITYHGGRNRQPIWNRK